MTKNKRIETVFGVRWVEVEFGERPEGWRIYSNVDDCIQITKEASLRGPYKDNGEDGYYGPDRPLIYHEIPALCLDKNVQEALAEGHTGQTKKNWNPKFKGPAVYIT